MHCVRTVKKSGIRKISSTALYSIASEFFDIDTFDGSFYQAVKAFQHKYNSSSEIHHCPPLVRDAKVLLLVLLLFCLHLIKMVIDNLRALYC